MNRYSLIWRKLVFFSLLGTLFVLSTAIDEPPATETCCLADDSSDEIIVFSVSGSGNDVGQISLGFNGDKRLDLRLRSGREATFSNDGSQGSFLRNVVVAGDSLTVFMKSEAEIKQKQGAFELLTWWKSLTKEQRAAWRSEQSKRDMEVSIRLFMTLGIPAMRLTYDPVDQLVFVKATYGPSGDKAGGTSKGRLTVTLTY